MARRGTLLQARLRPPRVPRDAVERPELTDRLLALLDGPAVTIAAGAGYGKTTLLAIAARADPRPWAWCSCDSRLRDLQGFANRIAAAVAVLAPGFEAGLNFVEADADEVAGILADALYDSLAEEWVLVIDDAHLLSESAASLLPALIEALPDEAHLLVASRREVPIPSARARLLGVAGLTEDELRFSDEDASALIRAYQPDIATPERERLVRDAEGWAAGLVLGASAGGLSGDLRFEYLAEEVVARLPEERQDFLMRTAITSRFDPALAEHLTSLPDARDIAEELLRLHMFISRVDSEHEWYRYHHLFKAFLIERFRDRDPQGSIAAHRAAAAWWAERSEPVEVVRHLIAAGNADAAAEYLEPIAEDLVRTPDAELVASWLETLGEPLWSTRPSLVAAHAALLLNRARHEDAFTEFERAIEYFAGQGDQDRAAALTLRLQQAMVRAGTKPERRISAGEKSAARLGRTARALPAVRIMQGCAYGYACRFEEARHELSMAESLPAYTDDFEAMSQVARAFYIDFWQQSAPQALATLSAARMKLSSGDDPLGLEPVVSMLEVYLKVELGYVDDVRIDVHDLFEQAGMGRDAGKRSDAWVMSTIYVGIERWDLVEQTIGEPPHASDPASATSYSHRYRIPAAQLAAARGKRSEAEAQIRACRNEMSAFGAHFDRGTFLCDLTRAALMAGNDRLALELAREALAFATSIESPWQRARAALAIAASTPDSANEIELALALTEQHDLAPLWTHRDRGIAASILSRAVELELGPPGLPQRLRASLDGEAAAVGAAAQASTVAGTVRPWTDAERERWMGSPQEELSSTVVAQARLLIGRSHSHEDGMQHHTRFLLAAARELERRGELAEAVDCYRKLAEEPEIDEGWHRNLMRLLASLGRPAEALRQYHVCRARLLRDAGRGPSAATEDLYCTLLMARDREDASGEAQRLTVVFTDIVGSTELAERYGDRRWARLVADHESLLAVHAGEFGGRVVKTQGDGAMLAFDAPEGALGFAASVVRALSVASSPDARLPVRVGIHSGDAVRHGDDYLGRTVIVAARLMDAARGDEILVSSATRELLDENPRTFTDERALRLKGLEEQILAARLPVEAGELAKANSGASLPPG